MQRMLSLAADHVDDGIQTVFDCFQIVVPSRHEYFLNETTYFHAFGSRACFADCEEVFFKTQSLTKK